MSKIHRHRIVVNELNKQNENNINKNNTTNYIFINDQLTPHNRRMLWLAKTKASESKWDFVWVRNGNIIAKKTENSTPIIIYNASDIEVIA